MRLDQHTRRASEELVRWIRSDDEAGYKAKISELQADPPSLRSLLLDLTHHSDVDIRDWLALNVARIAPEAAPEILRQLLKDNDPDVREVAADELVRRVPAAAAEMRSIYLRQLDGPDFYDPVRGMWGLAALRDRDSLAAIRAAGEKQGRAGKTFVRITAEVACALIEGREQEILQALKSHDHERAAQLANAARMIRSPEAIATLRECSVDARDEECRALCALELRKVSEI